MDDFVVFWKCLAVVFCVGIVTAGGCTAHQNKLQTDVMEKAANPALLQCSFSDDARKSSAFCVEVARQK